LTGHGGLLNFEEWNIFKSNNKEYDETVYPVDHARSGQIRDFSLFNNFVKPMPAGVTVTCVMDCCVSFVHLEIGECIACLLFLLWKWHLQHLAFVSFLLIVLALVFFFLVSFSIGTFQYRKRYDRIVYPISSL
jgi:hypothetical protein